MIVRQQYQTRGGALDRSMDWVRYDKRILNWFIPHGMFTVQRYLLAMRPTLASSGVQRPS